MRKTDKKIDKQIRQVLTEVCENALKEINGFVWLTHTVNYDNFPASLKVVCVFETNQTLTTFLQNEQKQAFISLIVSQLKFIDIKSKKLSNSILFDSEEQCQAEHNGNWNLRLSCH